MKNKVIVLILSLATNASSLIAAAEPQVVERPDLGEFQELPIEITREIVKPLPYATLKELEKTSSAFYSIVYDVLGHRDTIKYWSATQIRSEKIITGPVEPVPGQASYMGEHYGVSSIAFSPTEPLLAYVSADSLTVKLFNLQTRKSSELARHLDKVESVAFSPDGRLLASGSRDGKIILWDVQTKKSRVVLPGHITAVTSLVFASDGKTLASAPLNPGSIKLWDVKEGKEIPQSTEWSIKSAKAIAFSPDSKVFAALLAFVSDTIIVSNRETGELKQVRYEKSPYDVTSAIFLPNLTVLVSAASDSVIELVNVQTGDQIMKLVDPHSSVTFALAVSPDSKILASGTPNGIRLWDIKTGKIINRIPRQNIYVSSLSFSPDGKTLAAGYGDGTVILWKAE